MFELVHITMPRDKDKKTEEGIKEIMNVKRVLSGVILFPLVAILLIFGNQYIVDIAIAAISVLSIHEFYKAFKTSKKANPVSWLGYLAGAMIALIHVLPITWVLKTIGVLLPISILVLFLYVIITNLKINIQDIAITFFGIFYVVIFLMFIPIIRENLPNGKLLIWYVFFTAWGTDIFAYVVGKTLGKRHYTQISPNKTIEGCLGGIVGAVVLTTIYTACCQFIFKVQFNYIAMMFICLLLSIVSQIGDLAASSIKRYTGIKDFSNLIPGHGGMLDRIDSIIFIAPFAYFLFMML